MTSIPNQKEIVFLEYQDVVQGLDLNHKIKQAFGHEGLGLLVVNEVPRIEELRQNLLPLAYKLGNLSDLEKDKISHPGSFYSFGWSHGKEIFKGKPDYSKGSFYANPLYDIPYLEAEWIEKYPTFCHPNIWPNDSVPALEGAFKAVGKAISDLGLLIVQHCDRYLEKEYGFGPKDFLYPTVKESRTPKGRLLYYFPTSQNHKESEWCGWHRDHGYLTGLLPAMYFDEKGNQIQNPDTEAGLYIKDRHGKLHRAVASKGQVIFQIGEAAQILSGGALEATPHYVRGPSNQQSIGTSRSTFALFMDPYLKQQMDLPTQKNNLSEFYEKENEIASADYPSLIGRWEPGISYDEFSVRTYKAYYEPR